MPHGQTPTPTFGVRLNITAVRDLLTVLLCVVFGAVDVQISVFRRSDDSIFRNTTSFAGPAWMEL